jgi:MarR family transcriptional regulator, organic hydroperoxide resistance regulator
MADTLTLEDQLCFGLYAASMAINRVYKPLLDQLGITYPQYLVLNALWEEDGRTVGSIAERLSLEPSTVTPLVKRLEVSQLVSRTRHPEDERRVVVSLTQRGRELEADSRCLGQELLTRSGLEPQALMALNAQVQQLRQALSNT